MSAFSKPLANLSMSRRVPVVMQMSAVECGAACLAMILSYYGRKTEVEECRELIGVGRDGISAKTIAHVARQFGLRVKAYSVELEAFEFVSLPAIAHWNFDHFVVIEKWSPDKIEIVDPATGRRTVSLAEFDRSFTGVVLTFEPGVLFDGSRQNQPPNAKSRAIWRQYFLGLAQLPKITHVFFQVLLASLVLQLLGLALPIFTEVIVDDILRFQMQDTLKVMGLGLLLVVVAQFVINFLRASLLIYLQARLDSQLMLGFFEHLLTLPYRFFQQRTSGDLLMRLNSNSIIRETLTSQSLSIILDSLFVSVYLAILFYREASFGLIVLGLGLLQISILAVTTRRIHHLTENDLAAQADSQSYLVETLNGIAMLKASGSEYHAFDHWSNLFFKQLNTSLKRNYISAISNTLLGTLRSFSPLILLWIGAQQVMQGDMTLGAMLALNSLAASFLMPLNSLVSTGQQLQMVGAHLRRIADVLQAEPEQQLKTTKQAPALAGRIEVKDLSFRYTPQSAWTLHNLSFSIEPGQKIAIVGPTGSGKSTLAMLLVGLYQATEGQICFDNVDLRNLDYHSLRKQIGFVMQESFLFSTSIRHNIAFHNPEMPLEAIMAAAEISCIHAEIAQLPMGYETRLAEGGAGLSGGQRQRLALARALANQPRILVLDEATSHLDAETERRVDKNLQALLCTRIIIAHRLSTVREADLILVLNQGRIVEQGTHQKLLAQDGYYTVLVQGQLEGQKPRPAIEEGTKLYAPL